jgi:tetratricopeptide (TPR) repeat protein
MPRAPRDRSLWPAVGFLRHAGAATLLLALALAIYANSLHADLLVDNRVVILEDPRIRALSGENLRLIFTRDYWWPKYVTGVYRPLVTLSYLLDYAGLGHAARPLGYHVVNLLLHWSNGVLAYLLVLALAGAFWPALWSGVLFVAHPVATEAVTNVVGRADLMATLAVLGGVVLHAKATRTDGWRAALCLVGLGLAALAGVLSKESAAVLLGVVAAWDVLRPGGERVRVASYVVVVSVLLGLAALRAALAGNLGPRMLLFGDNPLFGAGFWAGRMTAIKVIGEELWLLLWPQWLSCDYSYDQIPVFTWAAGSWESWKAVVALAALATLAAVTVLQARRHRATSFLVAFFLVALLPSANLVLLIGTIMAERFLYLPLVAFAAGVALVTFAGARRLVPRHAPLTAGALLALVAFAYGVRAARRNVDWQDGVRLWSSAVVAAPRSFKTHYGLAAALDAAGGPERANLEASIREDEAALAIVDEKPLPLADQPSVVPSSLGFYYWTMAERLAARGGEPDEAARWYEKAATMLARGARLERAENARFRARSIASGRPAGLSHEIGSATTYRYLGYANARLGRIRAARDAFVRQRRLAPDSADVYRNVASSYAAEQRWERAAITLLQAFAVAGPQQVAPSLLSIYSHLDGGACANAGDGSLDLHCPLVHAHACRAYAKLERVLLAAHLEPSARHVRDQAVRYLDCPAETFR